MAAVLMVTGHARLEDNNPTLRCAPAFTEHACAVLFDVQLACCVVAWRGVAERAPA